MVPESQRETGSPTRCGKAIPIGSGSQAIPTRLRQPWGGLHIPAGSPPQANQTPSESQARLFTFHRTRQNRLSSNQAAELLSFVTVNFPVRHPEALPQPHRATHRGLRPEGGRAPFLLLLQCLTAAVALGQVRISEFLASNAQSHPDIVDFTDYPDWIELENTTDQPVSLGGWYLSDDPARPLRWAFPSTMSP